MKRWSLKAIATGTLVAFALDLVTSVVSFMAFGGDVLQPGATQEEIKAVADLVQQNDAYLMAALVFGTLTTVIGGYVTARMARQLPLLNAAAMGVLGVAIGMLLGAQGDGPFWLTAAGVLATIPAAVVGGYWGRGAREIGR